MWGIARVELVSWEYGTVVGVARFVVQEKLLFWAAFSAAFLDDLGLPSNFLRVLPIVFLYQLYICSRKRGSGSVTSWNSAGRPNVVMNSVACSRANFFASPRMEPWDLRSNSLIRKSNQVAVLC